MRIIAERAEYHCEGPCSMAYIAEVTVEDQVDKKPVVYYVNATLYDDINYGVYKKSVFDESDGDLGMLEEYENVEEVRESRFSKYFEIVDRMIDELRG